MPSQDPRWPNLFLVGPHKTGTTAWYETLDAHPEVFMAPKKEPEYLNQDHTYTQRPVESLEAYLALFEEGVDAKRRGDASPWYFYSEEATRRIREDSPDPRVLITLRDPVDRLYSLHSQRVHAGTEPIEDFEEALAAEPDRRKGKRVPERANPVLGNLYREIAGYADHVERWLDTFEDHEVEVLRFDRFVEDRTGTYAHVCRFLGIDDTFEPTFERSNPNTEVISHGLRDWVRDPPQIVQGVTKHLPLSWRDAARDALLELNSWRTEREPLDPEIRRQLVEELRPDNERLEELLGWDLSEWKEP